MDVIYLLKQAPNDSDDSCHLTSEIIQKGFVGVIYWFKEGNLMIQMIALLKFIKSFPGLLYIKTRPVRCIFNLESLTEGSEEGYTVYI